MYIVKKHKIYFEPLASFSCMFREQINLIFYQQYMYNMFILPFQKVPKQNGKIL
jgi:hypothetical protein